MYRRIARLAWALVWVTLSACGAFHSASESTADAARWVFIAPVKTMKLDLVSREQLNPTGAGVSLSTVVRIYQLKSPRAFEELDYDRFESGDVLSLGADLLAARDVTLRPGAKLSIDQPMDRGSSHVGVVALFRSPGVDATWKVLVPVKQWRKSGVVNIEVRDNSLVVQ